MKESRAYEIVQHQRIEDIHADGYLLRHKKSGARVMILENDDDNKVFNIAFRTPPADSTGGIISWKIWMRLSNITAWCITR